MNRWFVIVAAVLTVLFRTTLVFRVGYETSPLDPVLRGLLQRPEPWAQTSTTSRG